jgi:hypothetical protein
MRQFLQLIEDVVEELTRVVIYHVLNVITTAVVRFPN